MVELFWTGVCKGGYVTHGESYLSDDDIIWWSHGGRLKGESMPRIAFLRAIIEQGPPKRLTPFVRTQDSHWDAAIGFMDDDYGLIYFGDSQPQFKLMTMLPDGVDYRVDVIDTWAMTITPWAVRCAPASVWRCPAGPVSPCVCKKRRTSSARALPGPSGVNQGVVSAGC